MASHLAFPSLQNGNIILLTSNAVLLQVGSWTSSFSITGSLLEMQILKPCPRPIESEPGVGWMSLCFKNPPGDYDVC